MCARVVPPLIPAMMPRAPGSHHGAPRPLNAGTKATPPLSGTDAASPAVSDAEAMDSLMPGRQFARRPRHDGLDFLLVLLIFPAAATAPARRKSRIGVSTYSFFQFRYKDYQSIESCIDLAAKLGFDGVEILRRQVGEPTAQQMRDFKRRAFANGLDLMGYSTHQTFLRPDPAERKKNIEETIRFIDEAHEMGIPTVRVNTGRWDTSANFDELMKNRGLEPPIAGHTDEEAFGWVKEAFEQIVPHAEKRGVVLGMENPWGLAISPDGRWAAVVAHAGSTKAATSPFATPTGKLIVFRIDGTDLIRKSEAPIGRWSQGVAFSKDAKTLLVQNMVERNLMVFDFSAERLVDTGLRFELKGGGAALRTAR